MKAVLIIVVGENLFLFYKINSEQIIHDDIPERCSPITVTGICPENKTVRLIE